MAAKVLVTGSSGFLGAGVAARLHEAGHEVVGFDCAPPVPEAGYRGVRGDLTDHDLVATVLRDMRPTHVVHAGGVSGPMVLPDQPAAVMAINVAGSLNLLEAALAVGVSRFVHCSSVSAVGPFSSAEPIGEDHPLRPDSPYGFSKAAMEMVLRGLWRRVPMELMALRFTGIYGPGRTTSFLLDDMVAAALSHQPIRIPPTRPGPFLYGDDAADAAVAACFAAAPKQLAYYVAYPELVSVEMIRSIITDVVGTFDCEVDATQPTVERGPLDLAPTQADLGFVARVGIHAGLPQLIAARRMAMRF